MTASKHEQRETYSVDEAAVVLGIGRNAAYEAARRGDIPVIRIGGRILIPKKALRQLLEPEEQANKAALQGSGR